MNSLVRFWDKCSLTRPPYIHPDDLEIVRSRPHQFDRVVRSPKQFIESDSFGEFKDRSFHLSLLPVPFLGRLDTAKIVILLLNPGLGLSDYVTDSDKKHARWSKKVIRQQLDGAEYPFISLNPEFSWTGGFQWWEKKLREVLRVIAKKEFDGRYLDALKFLSKRLACVELVPYHSQRFGGSSLVDRMPSAQAALHYVKHTLVPKAREGRIKLIATRQIARWSLPKNCRHIIRYEGSLTRGAPLGPRTLGGAAMLEILGVGRSR
jgi:hypothetical protein